jgi:hypothetical protein
VTVFFAPDGRHLAVANQNGTICILRLTELLKMGAAAGGEFMARKPATR